MRWMLTKTIALVALGWVSANSAFAEEKGKHCYVAEGEGVICPRSLVFSCRWGEGGGEYDIHYIVDLVTGIAKREKSIASYRVLSVEQGGLSLLVEAPFWPNTGWGYVAVHTFERPSGGWFETNIWPDGTVHSYRGGTCLERNVDWQGERQ